MDRLLRVGLTGGIGSGKSVAARLLEMMGAAVYTADDRAKELMVEDDVLHRGIVDLFGSDAFLSDGNLNRKMIASRVFSNVVLRERLNLLVHPVVESDFVAWAVREADKSPRPAYAVEEAAVLIESGGWRRMDCVVVVTAPVEVRVERVMRRDGASRAQALARIAAQMDERTRLAFANRVLSADDRQLFIPQVVELHRALCASRARI